MKPKRFTIKARVLARVATAALVLAAFTVFESRAYAAVVGYVNVILTNGYNFVANPFDSGTNDLGTAVPTAPDGTRAYVWDVTNQVFLPPSTYSNALGGWNRDYSVPTGKGFVILANAPFTNTCVGNVLQGHMTNFVAGSNKFSLLASMIPAGGPLGGAWPYLGFPGSDGEDCLLFDTTNQTYLDAWTYFSGYGWFNSAGATRTNGPLLNVAQSFFVQNPGPDAIWGGLFHVQVVQAQMNLVTASSSTAPEISRIRVRDRNVTLDVLNPSGGPYNVQFSTDVVTWTTLARNQTGPAWTGKCPAGAQGYYQVVQP